MLLPVIKDTRRTGGTGGCCELDQTLRCFWEIKSYGLLVSDRIVCTEEGRITGVGHSKQFWSLQ